MLKTNLMQLIEVGDYASDLISLATNSREVDSIVN